MTNIKMVADIIEENGKTIRQNNLEKSHMIPLGALVEVTYESSYDEDSMCGVRMFVVKHSRDCDGTPLYDLSFDKNAQKEVEDLEQQLERVHGEEYRLCMLIKWKEEGKISRHWGEDSLKEINTIKI